MSATPAVLVSLALAFAAMLALYALERLTDRPDPITPDPGRIETMTPDVIKIIVDELFAMLEKSLVGRPLLLMALEFIKHLAESMLPALGSKLGAK